MKTAKCYLWTKKSCVKGAFEQFLGKTCWGRGHDTKDLSIFKNLVHNPDKDWIHLPHNIQSIYICWIALETCCQWKTNGIMTNNHCEKCMSVCSTLHQQVVLAPSKSSMLLSCILTVQFTFLAISRHLTQQKNKHRHNSQASKMTVRSQVANDGFMSYHKISNCLDDK